MKRIYKKLFFIILLTLVFVVSKAQNDIGRIWQCNTIESIKSKSIAELNRTVIDTSPKIINIFVHILRRDNGTGGLTEPQINNWISLLCSDYLAHQIVIREIGRSYLNNSTFYNGMTDANYSTLIATNTHSNAIDVYLLSPDDTYSRASGIPGVALAVGGDYSETSVLSHEFGHCLGLFHTHSGRGCNDFANCSENIDGSNCSTCGDLICDTPADPCLAGNVNTNCEYIGDSDFAPDVHNIMSYSPPDCLNDLTTGQTIRIHSMILDNSIFTTRSFIPSISGPSFICSSGNSFTVNNLPPGTTITWDQNSYLTRVSSQGSNPCTFAAAGQGSGWIEASITTGCGTIDLPRKEVNADPGITGEYAQGTTWKTLYTVNFISREETTVVSVESEGASSLFNWQLLPEGSVVNWGSYNTDNSIIGFNIISGSQASFSVSTTNVCGSTVNGYYYFVVSGGYSLSLSPNPSSGETTLTIEGTPEGGGDEEWIMEVYTSTQVLKEKKTRLKGKEYKLNTSGWKKGIYIVNVKYGDEILTARLVVGE